MHGLQRAVKAARRAPGWDTALQRLCPVRGRGSAQTIDLPSSDDGLPGSGARLWWRMSAHFAALLQMARKSVMRAQWESGHAVLRPPPQNASGTHANESTWAEERREERGERGEERDRDRDRKKERDDKTGSLAGDLTFARDRD